MEPRLHSKATLSRWAVERERFQLPDRRPPSPYRIQTPAHALTKVMQKLGLDDALWERSLLNEWPQLIGEPVAKHTRPGRLDRQTLIVFVEHSVWLQELRGPGEKAMLEKIQQRFGRNKIKGLRLQLDPAGGRGQAAS